MKNAFNELVAKMKQYDLYQADDEVGLALNNLEAKIDEVESRIICAIKTNEEIRTSISKFTDSVDKGESFVMRVDDHDVILRGTTDIGIALDMNEDMAVADDWYGLFRQRKDKEVCYIFESSWGHIEFNKYGYVIEVHGDIEISGERNYLYDIDRFDVNEYAKFCKEFNITHGESGDILAIGYFTKDGKYSEPDSTWRKNMFGEEEEEEEEDVKLKRGEPIPTALCMNLETNEVVKDIIAKLKAIEVDGETMQYILGQVGMEEQMFYQLHK